MLHKHTHTVMEPRREKNVPVVSLSMCRLPLYGEKKSFSSTIRRTHFIKREKFVFISIIAFILFRPLNCHSIAIWCVHNTAIKKCANFFHGCETPPIERSLNVIHWVSLFLPRIYWFLRPMWFISDFRRTMEWFLRMKADKSSLSLMRLIEPTECLYDNRHDSTTYN